MPYNKNDTFDLFDFGPDDGVWKGFTDTTGSDAFHDMWDANYVFWQDDL